MAKIVRLRNVDARPVACIELNIEEAVRKNVALRIGAGSYEHHFRSAAFFNIRQEDGVVHRPEIINIERIRNGTSEFIVLRIDNDGVALVEEDEGPV